MEKMKLVEHKEKIGIALTEEELFVNLQALTISKGILDIVNKFSDSGKIKHIINAITILETDYRSINEQYKEKVARKEVTNVLPPQNCEVCE